MAARSALPLLEGEVWGAVGTLCGQSVLRVPLSLSQLRRPVLHWSDVLVVGLAKIDYSFALNSRCHCCVQSEEKNLELLLHLLKDLATQGLRERVSDGAVRRASRSRRRDTFYSPFAARSSRVEWWASRCQDPPSRWAWE